MSVTLSAMKREDHARSATKELRRNGKIPAIVYGKEKESISVSVDSLELLKTVRDSGINSVISLNIEGDSSVQVMLHEYQKDDIKDQLIHADFYMIDMSREMETQVPVRLVGEPVNGVVQQPVYEVLVRATPDKIPNEITVDVSKKSIGDIITIAEIGESDSYEVVDEPETVVASFLAPNTNAVVEGQEETGEEPALTGQAQTNANED